MANKTPGKYPYKYHIPWIVWAIVLAVLMLLPSDSLPASKMLSYDKLGHLGVFLIFTFLILWSFNRQRHSTKLKTKSITWALTISIVYGSVLEYSQQFVPGRMTDLYDFAANTIGAIVGTIVFITFRKLSLRLVN
ncbi:MAG: VanZ family protein [Roseivirga sp.]|nr:VanZ family protein [Roseivirga sp.]